LATPPPEEAGSRVDARLQLVVVDMAVVEDERALDVDAGCVGVRVTARIGRADVVAGETCPCTRTTSSRSNGSPTTFTPVRRP
jgi:hypothetical protein